MHPWLLAAVVLLGTAVAPAAALDLKTVNEAQFSAKRGKGLDPVMIKAQVLLDRARFSPGVIDGRDGENVKKAVAASPRPMA